MYKHRLHHTNVNEVFVAGYVRIVAASSLYKIMLIWYSLLICMAQHNGE